MPPRRRASLAAAVAALLIVFLLLPVWAQFQPIGRLLEVLAGETTKGQVEVLANIGTLVTTLVGFWVLYVQLRDLYEQAQLSAKTARSEHYAAISNSMRELNRVFLERWDLRRYFYDGVSHEHVPEGSETSVLLDNVCEIILDFADDVVEQYRALPAGVDWSTWWAYFRFLFLASPKLRSFLWANYSEFYPDYVLQPFGFVVVRSGVDGTILGVWTLLPPRETDNADDALAAPAYPWVTTWSLAFHAQAPTRVAMLEVTGHYAATVRARLDGRPAWLRRWTRPVVVATVEESLDTAVPFEAIEAIRSWTIETMAFTNVELVEFVDPAGRISSRRDMRREGMAARAGEFAFPNRAGRG